MRRLAYFIVFFSGLLFGHTELMAQPGCLSISATTSTTSCFSGNDGQISLTITAGNPGQAQPPWDIELFFQDSGGGLTQLAFHDNVSVTSITFTPGNGSLNVAGAEAFGIPSNDFDPGSEYRINVRSTGGVLTCRNKTLTNIQVTEPTQINGTVNTITPACTVGTGAIALDVSGGSPLAGPPDYIYTWTGPTPIANTVEDPTNLDAGTYNVTIEDALGCTVDVLNIIVPMGPEAGADNTVSACNTNTAFDLFGSLSGTPDAGGSWAELTASGATITGNNVDFSGVTAGSYDFEYTVAGVAPCADATAIVTVNVVDAPDAGTNNTVSACNNDGAFDLFASLGGTPDGGGSWVQTSGAARTITGNDVDFVGATAGAYDFEYTVTGVAPCADATALVTVNVVDAPDAGTNNTVSACNTDGAFDLFTSLGGTPDGGGAWVQISGAARTITGNDVDFVGAAAGAYDFEYTVTGLAPCVDATAIVTVNVVDAPDAGTNNTVSACNTDGAFDLLASLGGTPDGGGAWVQTSGAARTITGNDVDFVGASAGAYDFEYTVTGVAPCADATALVTVNVVDAPDAGTNNTVSACNTDGAFDLFASLGGTPDGGGAWVQISGAARTITGNDVDFVGAAAGAYDFEYTVTGVAPCVDATAIVTVNVVDAPDAGTNNTVSACNTDVAFDLFASLGGTPDGGGTWVQISGAARIITGNDVDFVGASAGAYDFEYTVTGVAPCADATAIVTVNVVDAPDAGTNNTVNACNNDGAFDLLASLGGTPDGGGAWVQTSGAARTITGNDVDFIGASAGAYDFEYTVTGVAPCVDATAIVTVNVVDAPDAGTNNTVSACNTDVAFDLFTSLGGTPDGGGTWAEISASGAVITGNNVDFTGITPGTYDFEYTVTGAAPCVDVTAIVTVNLLAPPDAGADNSVSACSNVAAFDLFASLGGTPEVGGTWAQTSGAARTITGNNVDLVGAIAGAYEFEYTVTGTAPCADATAVVTVNVSDPPDPGLDNTVNTCNSDTAFDLFASLVGTPDVGGVWTEITAGGAVITGNTVDFTGIAGATYQFQYTITATGCNPVSSVVTVDLFDIPTATISGDATICTGQSNTITITLTGVGPWDIQYSDGGAPIAINGIAASPHTFSVSPAINTTYSLVSVTDARCGAGTVSGTATVSISPIAGNPATFGSETWLAYVYDDSGSPAPPATNIDFNNAKYRGFLDDTEIAAISGFSSYDVATDAFDLNLSNTVPVAGANICGSYLNDYSIRFRMTKTFAAGIYTFTLGADDGVRLLVDGVSVLPAGAFNTHSFTTYNSTPVCLTTGTHNLVIEYFDRGGFSRINFDYTAAPGPSVSTPVSLCVNSPAPTLSASSVGAIDYNWYTDAALSTLISSGANYTPLPAQLDMTIVGTTDFFVTAVYACGETPSSQVTVDVTSGANIVLPTPPVQVCDVGGIVDLSTFVSATPAGGTFTFSGTGVTASPNFDPSGLGNTTSTITVDYVAGTCSTSTTFDIDIVTNATITVPAGATACESGGIVDLTTLVSGNPGGGAFTFAGTGVVGAGPDFDPSGITGMTTVTVDYNVGGCAAPTQMFDIDVVPNVSLVVDNSTTVCPSGGPVDLAALITPSPTGGVLTFTGTGVTGTQFDPSGSAGSTIVINVSYDIGGCTAASTVQVVVRSATDPLCGGPTGNCATVVITPAPTAAICSPTDGSIMFNINPPVPTINNTGVRIDIVGTSTTNLGVSQTNFNDPLFTGLSVGTYDYTIEYGDPGCIKTGQVTVLLGPDVVDFTVAPNSVNCFGSAGGVVLSNINGSDLADYTYEVTQLGAVVSTGTITQLQSLGEVTVAGFGTGNFEIKLSQDQSATTTCPSPVQSARKPFTVTSPAANLDTLYVNKTVSVPDLPTGSMVVGIAESLQEPYEVRLELTQPLFPGQVYAQDFTEATRNALNLKVEFEAPNLFAGGYLLSLRDALGCRKDYPVTIDVDNNLMVPNIFTPNGDGINEVFFIRNIPDATEVMITNRWGKQVYSSTNYQNDWDGGDIADGVYYYRINAGGQSYSGWVEVLRGK
ncbi:MAG: gliding motility-associated C-terminal domain-containing protein [Cyclobacteriaceae bacterium]